MKGGIDMMDNLAATMHEHFSRVSPIYRYLRTLDVEPLQFMAETLQDKRHVIRVLDVGCGTGHYSLQFAKLIGRRYGYQNLLLVCFDSSAAMLSEAKRHFDECSIPNVTFVLGDANKLNNVSGQFDVTMTTNAIHHYDARQFIKKAKKVLKVGGYLFIYTRLMEQNRRTIWGQHFPKFVEKEGRLFARGELENIIAAEPGLRVHTVREFSFPRVSTLEALELKARNQHYSTFCFYTDEEFEEALTEFRSAIKRNYDDLNAIRHVDENILIVARKEDRG